MALNIIENYPEFVNKKDNGGRTGFIWACYKNYKPLVNAMIKLIPIIIEQKNNKGKLEIEYLNEEYFELTDKDLEIKRLKIENEKLKNIIIDIKKLIKFFVF